MSDGRDLRPQRGRADLRIETWLGVDEAGDEPNVGRDGTDDELDEAVGGGEPPDDEGVDEECPELLDRFESTGRGPEVALPEHVPDAELHELWDSRPEALDHGSRQEQEHEQNDARRRPQRLDLLHGSSCRYR